MQPRVSSCFKRRGERKRERERGKEKENSSNINSSWNF